MGGAERERDLHVDVSRRNEESAKRKQDEVSEYLSRIDRQTQDLAALRDDLRRRDDEVRRHQDTIAQLKRELEHATIGQGKSGGIQSGLPQAADGTTPLPAVASPVSSGEAGRNAIGL